MERPAAGSAAVTLPPVKSTAAAGESFAQRASALLWEDWLRHSPHGQQAEMLELAQRQGFLFTGQLALAKDAVAPSRPGDAVLERLLAGNVEQLPAAPLAVGTPGDVSLPPLQRLALARALRTPDVALIRARPGAAANVLAELAVQAARRGERVLLVAAGAAALDATLVKLHGRRAVLPVRLLAAAETIQGLPPPLRAFTLDEQRKTFQTTTLQQAEQARIDAEQGCRCRQLEEPVWPDLARIAQTYADLQAQSAALAARRASVPDEVVREAENVPRAEQARSSGPFALQVTELARRHAQELTELEARAGELEQAQADAAVQVCHLDAESRSLEPLASARRSGRWWTLAWWKALVRADATRRVEEIEAQKQTLHGRQAETGRAVAELAAERRRLEQQFTTQRAGMIEAEIERRQQEWTAQLEGVALQSAPLKQRWDELTARFKPASLAPEALTPAAVVAAQARWQQRRQDDEAARLFSGHWISFLKDAAPKFLARFPRYASLVAGTHAALHKHPEATDGGFDLVVIEEADRLLENDLLRLARHGKRWLLVGQLPEPPGRPTSFARLWQALHPRPMRRAYVFQREGERLCCQLRPVSPRDRRHLESERLADFPEIELRILTLPKAQPQLAQVVFPPSMTPAQAKAFIYRELQEVAVQGGGRHLWLEETEQTWRLQFDAAVAPVQACELERGLHEHLAADGATCRLEFAKDVGWQRAQVDDWLNRHFNFRDLGRTVDLT